MPMDAVENSLLLFHCCDLWWSFAVERLSTNAPVSMLDQGIPKYVDANGRSAH